MNQVSQKNFFQNMSASLMIFRHMAIFRGRPGHAPNSGILDWGVLLDSFMTGSAATVSSWAHTLFGIHLLTMTITEPWLERIRKV